MSGPFGVLNAAQAGASMASVWMDVLGHNLANLNTVTSTDEDAFRAKYLVLAESGQHGGVDIDEIVAATGDAPLVYDPAHPLADEDGMVQAPLVDPAGQMSDLIIASRQYQMNLQVVQAAEEAYQSALQIGRP